MLFTTLMSPWAMASQRTMPPKILTKMAVTLGSLVIRSKASLIACGVAPPPTSRKFAGDPPLSLIMSIVAMANPAPLTRHPISPSSLMKLRPDLLSVLVISNRRTHSAALTSSGSSCERSRQEKTSCWRKSALSSKPNLASMAST